MDDLPGPITIADNSGNGHTGNLQDINNNPVAIGSVFGPTVVASIPPSGLGVLNPKVNNALFFVRTYAEVANHTDFEISNSGWTLTMWFNSAGGINIQPLIDKFDSGSGSGYSLYLDSFNLQSGYQLNFQLNTAVIPIPSLPMRTWNFVAVTVDNNGIVTLYINSSSLSQQTVGSWLTSTPATLLIAANRSQPSVTPATTLWSTLIPGWVAGELALDEVKIFKCALSPSDIRAIYTNEFNGQKWP